MSWLQALTGAVAAGEPVALVTVVEAPQAPALLGRHLVAGARGALASEFSDPALEQALLGLAREALAGGRTGSVALEGLRVYVEPYLPAPELVVVGAGHVAQPVAHLGKMLGFRVTVIDDRPEYANHSRFPDADAVICGPFVETLRGLNPGPRHHIILVTRGHRHDMDCLRAIIHHPVAYIGMIGSRTRIQTVYRLLAEEHGVDPALFAKVCAPIGLDLGARTPAEIAISIAAELVKIRRGGTGESLSRLGRALVHTR